MKKKILYLILGCGLLSNNNVLSADSFEIELRSDRIVGSLWNGSSIPPDETEELFKLLDKNEKKYINNHQNNFSLNNFISEIYGLMEDTAKYREESEKNIKNINKFISDIKSLSIQYNPKTIQNGLYLISEKYEG